MLATAGADEVRHDAAFGDDQGGEHVLCEPLDAGIGGGYRSGSAKQHIESLAQELRAFVFLSTSTGLGGASWRERMRLPLGSTHQFGLFIFTSFREFCGKSHYPAWPP